MERLLAELKLERSAVSVFRTDDISVTPAKTEKASVPKKNKRIKNTECIIPNYKWAVELEGIPYHGVINRRLRHVFLTAQKVTFVYNNRVRKYSLAEGSLVANQAQRNARELSYKGEDISHLFLKTT